ncbi:hypothetical protein Syun_007583 [Stephania yunnanensis]|uniref:3-dehydrosphinganine reductase n=1 Tax=Stephania yunnanensis TaxID=152371 RepID=A0AAP0PYN1_9MAGN
MALLLLLFLLLIIIPISLLLTLSLIVRPKPTTIPIKGRHVFISGGSSGIGLALARQAAAEGARVSILARNPSNLQQARDSIRLSTGVDVAVFSADVRDFDAVKRAVEEAGPIDVLVCNQGVFVPRDLESQDMETVKSTIDVNVMGSFHLIKAALPSMKDRRDRGPGSIALTSSQAGQFLTCGGKCCAKNQRCTQYRKICISNHGSTDEMKGCLQWVGIYGYSAYSASKFALRGLAEALQQEVISENIHVTLIFPPDTETPGFVEESKIRPEVTNIIAASSGAMKADDVARKALNGIKSGSFFVPCNFEGLMLSLATAGMSPQKSALMAFVEVIAAGLLRIVALFFQWNWYDSIAKWNRKNK